MKINHSCVEEEKYGYTEYDGGTPPNMYFLLHPFKPDQFNRHSEMNTLCTNYPEKHLYNYLPVHGWDKPIKQYGMMHVEFSCTVSFLPRPAGFEDLNLRIPNDDDDSYYNYMQYPRGAIMSSHACHTNGMRVYYKIGNEPMDLPGPDAQRPLAADALDKDLVTQSSTQTKYIKQSDKHRKIENDKLPDYEETDGRS